MNTYRQCEKLVEQGLIRHIGMSNYDGTETEGGASP